MNLFESTISEFKTKSNEIYLEAVAKIFNILFEEQIETHTNADNDPKAFIDSTDPHTVLVTFLSKLVSQLGKIERMHELEMPNKQHIIDNTEDKRSYLRGYFGGMDTTSPILTLNRILKQLQEKSITDNQAYTGVVAAVKKLYSEAIPDSLESKQRIKKTLLDKFESPKASDPVPGAASFVYNNVMLPIMKTIAAFHDAWIPMINANPKMKELTAKGGKKKNGVYIGHDFLTSEDPVEPTQASAKVEPEKPEEAAPAEEEAPAVNEYRHLDGTVDVTGKLDPDTIQIPFDANTDTARIVGGIKQNLTVIAQKGRVGSKINPNYFTLTPGQIQNEDGSTTNVVNLKVENDLINKQSKGTGSLMTKHNIVAYAVYLDAQNRFGAGKATIGLNIANSVKHDMSDPRTPVLISLFPADIEALNASMPTRADLKGMLNNGDDQLAQKISLVLDDKMLANKDSFYTTLSAALKDADTDPDDIDFFGSDANETENEDPYLATLTESNLFEKINQFIADRKANLANTSGTGDYNATARRLVQTILSARSFKQMQRDQLRNQDAANKNKTVMLGDYDDDGSNAEAPSSDDIDVTDSDEVDI